MRLSILLLCIVTLATSSLSQETSCRDDLTVSSVDAARAIRLNQEGIKLFIENKPALALKAFEDSVKLDPSNEVVWSNIGSIYVAGSNSIEKSIMFFERAICINPKYVRGYYFLGTAYLDLKRYEDAEKLFKRVIELDEAHLGAVNNLGLTYLRQKRFEEARTLLSEKIRGRPEIDPETLSYLLSNLGAANYYLKQFSDSFDAYSLCHQLVPNDTNIAFNLAVVSLKLNRRDSALRLYKTLQSSNSVLAKRLFNGLFSSKILEIEIP
ncbi:MAG: tetratricopeptide repeat protein [Pyrinomonadaceae bacterium]|nr:tetratricopeptide repeat protein [Pyrinomonadaceae bacterium]